MPFTVVLAPGAVESYRALRAFDHSQVRDALERHLTHEPTRTSKSRIKRLRGISQPQYRRRVGDLRISYDVKGKTVEVVAIVGKAEAEAWLGQHGQDDDS